MNTREELKAALSKLTPDQKKRMSEMMEISGKLLKEGKTIEAFKYLNQVKINESVSSK